MKNTAEIRRQNMSHILQIMRDGKEHTVRTVAERTGLSVATCNTILNELCRSGKIIGSKRQLNEVGRYSTVYKINEEYESSLLVWYRTSGGKKEFLASVVYSYGGARVFEYEDCEVFSDEMAGDFINRVLNKYGGIVKAAIGLPFEESYRIPSLKNYLSAVVSVPVIVARDYDFIALATKNKNLITVIDSSGNIPVAIHIFEGKIAGSGSDFGRFAFPNVPAEVSLAAGSAILLSPERIIFVGAKDGAAVDEYEKACARLIPEDKMPRTECWDSIEHLYMLGMCEALGKDC